MSHPSHQKDNEYSHTEGGGKSEDAHGEEGEDYVGQGEVEADGSASAHHSAARHRNRHFLPPAW